MKVINTCPFNLKDGKTRILWEITPACNMKCKHCLFFSNNKDFNLKALSTDEIFKIIDNISKDSSLNAIWLSGGEPLLRKDIVEICKYISSKKIIPSISTNGVLMTPELAKKLYEAGVNYIHLSIDGSTPETHDRLRGVDGAFEKLMKAIKILKDSPIKIGASFMVTDESINEIEEVVKIAIDNKLQVMSFYLVAKLGRGAENFKKDDKSLEEKLLEKMSIINKKPIKDLKIEIFRVKKEEEKVLQECKGYNFMNITYDGKLGACPWLMKSSFGFDVGSLLKEDFLELKEKCVSKMKEQIEKRKNSVELCKKCTYRDNCGRGCLALQIDDKNSKYYGVDPLCQMIKK